MLLLLALRQVLVLLLLLALVLKQLQLQQACIYFRIFSCEWAALYDRASLTQCRDVGVHATACIREAGHSYGACTAPTESQGHVSGEPGQGAAALSTA